jgi:hypothetical protein
LKKKLFFATNCIYISWQKSTWKNKRII